MKTQRELSQQAQVAKRIREYAKSLGIKCKARSSSFSMGDDVTWSVENVHPDIFKKIENFANEHQYGHFNGMEDIYEYSNKRLDIPQSKYIFGANQFSEEMEQKAYNWLCSQYPGNAKDLPASYAEAHELNWFDGVKDFNHHQMVRQQVYEVLSGDDLGCENWREFWDSIKTPKHCPISVISGSAHIEEHTHTKKGFQMFIVVMSEHVGRDEFNRLRDEAKGLGGWYSRKWGSTPCGFAFRDISAAEQFLSEQFGGKDPDPTGTDDQKPSKPNTSRADKLRSIADKLETQIESKLADRETNTPRKLKMAMSARLEGEQLKRTQSVLYALADLHESGNAPEALQRFTTKKAIYEAMTSEKTIVDNGFHTYYAETGRPHSAYKDDPGVSELWGLLTSKSEEDKKADELQRKINGLQFSNIPGYFPTPQPVIGLMLEHANIQPGHSVLEPSAGHGAILDALPLCSPGAYEINHTLKDILTLKGWPLLGDDFLESDPSVGWDRIIMNPPFEKLQDVDHVRHAYQSLNESGRLVSIMSPGPFFRSDRKCSDFREWIDSLGGEVIDLPDGSFKESGTGVASKLLILDK